MTWAQVGATIAIVIGVCSLLDFVLSKKEIELSHLSLVHWWNELDELNVAETIRRSSAFFVRLFDVVYGPRAFSVRRAGMSALTTVLAILIVARFRIVQSNYQTSDIGMLLVFPVAFLANLIVDFISYNKTRWILKKSEDESLRKIGLLLIFDVALTTAIYIVGTSAIYIPLRLHSEMGGGQEGEYEALCFKVWQGD